MLAVSIDETYVRRMILRRFLRQLGAYLISLGIILSGAQQAWATPVHPASKTVTMALASGMSMNCMHAGMNKVAKPNAPCKSGCKQMDCCAGVGGCSFLFGAVSEGSSISRSMHTARIALPRNMNNSGIATRPALPPPIVLS